MPLTDTQSRNAKPQSKAYKLSDLDEPFLLINRSGSKLWRMKYRVHGKEKLLSIGKYPDVSLADARRIREKARSALAAGFDPDAERQERNRAKRNRLGATFSSQAESFIEETCKEGHAKSTVDMTEWLVGMATDAFGSKPMTDVTANMILACIWRFEAKGNYETARRLRAKIGAVFHYADANGVAEDPTYALRDALVTPTVRPRAQGNYPTPHGPSLI